MRISRLKLRETSRRTTQRQADDPSGKHIEPTRRGERADLAHRPTYGRNSSAPAADSITLQPEGEVLSVDWAKGRATVTLPKVDLYSILVVQP